MSTRRTFLKQGAAATVAVAASARRLDASDHPPPARSKETVLRLAIVGTGQISHRYLRQGAVSNRARFVATCARTISSAKARAVEYGIDAWFDDYAAMYDAVSPDAVIIATPTALHAPQALQAFERGMHVLCEKPMATTFEDCQMMVAAGQRGGLVFLSLPYDAHPPFLEALKHLNVKTLGAFTGAEAQALLPGTSRDNWYYDRKVAGGGAGLDTLVYPVSSLVGMLGPARRVTGFANTLIPRRILGSGETVDVVPPPRDASKGSVVESTVDDNVTLLIEWPGGQQAVVRALWGTSIVRFDSAIYGRHGTLWLSANDVVIHSPEKVIPNAEPVAWGSYKDCYRIAVKAAGGWENEGLIEHFVDCIEGRSQPTCSGLQQLHVHEILFKGYDAARTGRAQDLQTTFTPWHHSDPMFHDTRSHPI